MLDRIAGYFGYVPAPPPIPLEPPREDLHDAHRRDIDKFDYTKAHAGRWFFHYSEGDCFFAALGKDGWPPLALACAVLSGDADLAAHEIRHGGYIFPKVFQDWDLANRRILHQFADALTDIDGRRRMTLGSCNEASFETIRAGEFGHLFEYVHKVSRPRLNGELLASSNAGMIFSESPEIKNLRDAIRSMEERFFEQASNWFETRSVTVDRQTGLVRLPGYQALFSINDVID